MANYPTKKAPRRQPPKRSGMSLVLAVLCGYTLAWLYPPQTLTDFIERYGDGNKPAMEVAQVEEGVELPKPQFEFYTLLTQEKGAIPASAPPVNVALETPKPEKIEQPEKVELEDVEPVTPVVATMAPVAQATPSAVVPVVTASASKYIYLLQLAAFQRRQDAEQMKASLAMRGLDVRIDAANQSGGVWYRVVIGPFTARTQAEKIQAEVSRAEHISGIIRRMDA